MSKKYVYMFSEGNAGMRNLLGGKGANLAEMTNLGLPVPYGFTISTEACTEYNEAGRPRKSPAGFRSFRCESIHARYDGYCSEPWAE